MPWSVLVIFSGVEELAVFGSRVIVHSKINSATGDVLKEELLTDETEYFIHQVLET